MFLQTITFSDIIGRTITFFIISIVWDGLVYFGMMTQYIYISRCGRNQLENFRDNL